MVQCWCDDVELYSGRYDSLSPPTQECLEGSVGVAAEARQGEVVNERVGGESQVDKVGQCSHDVDVRRLAQPFIQEKWKYR